MSVGSPRAGDRAYARLRAEIIDGELAPGAPLGEIEQSERIGVSRTPLREALARLTAEGLVVAPGRTARVAPLEREDVIALYELREALEVHAARLAARRRDPARFEELLTVVGGGAGAGADAERPYRVADLLDAAIDEAVGNARLAAELDAVRAQMARVRRRAHADPERLARATDEHARIAEAIRDGREDLAAAATTVHLAASLEHVLASLPAS